MTFNDLYHFGFSVCYVLFLHIQIVARTDGMHIDVWVENADRFVAGFLEMFSPVLEGGREVKGSGSRSCV